MQLFSNCSGHENSLSATDAIGELCIALSLQNITANRQNMFSLVFIQRWFIANRINRCQLQTASSTIHLHIEDLTILSGVTFF